MKTVSIILLVICILTLIVLLWGIIEAMCLKITRDRIIIDKDSKDKNPDLRILYFSDLHRELCLIPAGRVIRLIRSENASQGLDAVIFGGDICNGHEHAKHGLRYLQAIADVCKELSIPYMAVTGNHDAGVPAEELGMFSFDNMDGCIKYLKSRRDGRYIAFAGVPDTGRKNRVWGTPPTPSAGIEYKSYVLLSHNPDIALHLPSDLPFRIDAMLSGHIHGGQIRTHFKLEFYLRHDELPYQGIISGLHEINGINVFIDFCIAACTGSWLTLLFIAIIAFCDITIVSINKIKSANTSQ